MNPVAVKLRESKDTVDDDFVLKRDVTFRSSSTAASFVTGSIANGMRVWKLKTESHWAVYRKNKIHK